MTTSQWKDIFEAAAHGDENAVRYFVEVRGVSVKSLTDEKQTLAHIAAANTHIKVLKYVLGKEPSLLTFKDIYENTVLYHAVERGFLPIVKYLVDELKANVYEPLNPSMGNNVIHVAAEEARMDVLKYFVEDKKVDVDTRNVDGETPLFAAAAKVRMPAVEYLVEKGNASVRTTDNYNNTILYVSAKIGDLNVPRYLMDTRKISLDVNGGNDLGRTAVYIAAGHNQLALLKYLVEEKHADVNKCDELGRSPLYSACCNGNLRVVKYLIKQGADPNVEDRFGMTARDASTNEDVSQYLDQVSRASRDRRSVPRQLSFDSGRSEEENAYWPRITVNSPGSSRLEKANATQINQYLFFLLICTKYGRKFERERLKLLSPAEILQDRIETHTLDVVKAIRDAEFSF